MQIWYFLDDGALPLATFLVHVRLVFGILKQIKIRVLNEFKTNNLLLETIWFGLHGFVYLQIFGY